MRLDQELSEELIYPYAKVPEPGETLEIAPGLRWLRMPMPMALNHINLWAIEEDDGWTLIDTGLSTPETMAIWDRFFSAALKPVTRVLVTHMHPDHIGLAGWITRKFDCRLWITRLEYLSCRIMFPDAGQDAPRDALRFYRRAGWTPGQIENYQSRFGDFRKFIDPIPDSFRRISDGETLKIGRYDWRIIVGTGHSPEHACLYCPELKIFISGDQVLPRISSNVSVHATEPDADPISDWHGSLSKLKQEIPNDVLVLPSHQEPFYNLHGRLDALTHSQEQTIQRLRAALTQPKRIVDLFGALFTRDIGSDANLLSLATGEARACVNYLLRRGAARAEPDDAGTVWYQALPPQ